MSNFAIYRGRTKQNYLPEEPLPVWVETMIQDYRKIPAYVADSDGGGFNLSFIWTVIPRKSESKWNLITCYLISKVLQIFQTQTMKQLLGNKQYESTQQ